MSSGDGDGGLVLFAYDGSDFARRAIEEAGRQLRTGRAALVLSVVTPLESIPFWGGPFSTIPAEVAEDIFGSATEVAEEGAALARGAGFEAEAAVERGYPVWSEIVEAAERHRAGLVVLGSHGRTGFRHVLLGSVASAVVEHSKRPVLIVHAGGASS
ncbi:MAG: universal stress protein [Solirubrobacterales bacterium]